MKLFDEIPVAKLNEYVNFVDGSCSKPTETVSSYRYSHKKIKNKNNCAPVSF
jgi:hypothetical protein